MSKANALSNASRVKISEGRTFSRTNLTTARPASSNNRSRPASVAKIDPFPGNANPSASHKQFIEFAVNIPEHEPQVGHAFISISRSFPSSILFADNCPTASNTDARSSAFPVTGSNPAFIGPPETNTAGMFTRATAIIMPGTILSQFGMHTTPSKQCARNIVSTESAINSRDAKEYFIPPCPIAIPSSTPIVLNSNGTPPAALTAALTFLPTTSR